VGGAPIVAWEAICGVRFASAVDAAVGYSTHDTMM